MKKTHIINILIIFIVLSVFAYAVPPQTPVNTDLPTLNIEYPKQDFFFNNKNITLHFHIYNSTSYILNDTDVDCLIHVYNSVGSHIVEENLTFDENEVDFYVNISTSLLNNTNYAYIIHCNSTQGEAGFLSTSFYVKNENETNNPEFLFISVIITVLVIIGILIFLYMAIDESHLPLKAIIYFSILSMGLVPITFLTNFISTFSNNNGISNVGNVLFSIYFIFMFIILMYFAGWYTIWYIKKLQSKKEKNGDI